MSYLSRNQIYLTGKEESYISQAILNRRFSGDGAFCHRCEKLLQENTGSATALLVPSCTAALELAALLCDFQSGDEVIMPSFTFSTTASSFIRTGAIPVFVDVEPDTLTLSPEAVARAVTSKTRAVVPVHYAGCACHMEDILSIARDFNLKVVEDAAQGLMAFDGGRPLGSIGTFGCISFHESKNVQCGEGGALLINDPQFIERAEILREKGTDRSRFFRGQVDKYTWRDCGSSYLLSELNAAFLWAQLEEAENITYQRLRVFNRYRELLSPLEKAGILQLPRPSTRQRHNAHIFYIICSSEKERDELIIFLKDHGIAAFFHYVPLHSSPAGKKFCRTSGELLITENLSSRLLRLPVYVGMSDNDILYVVNTISSYFKSKYSKLCIFS